MGFSIYSYCEHKPSKNSMLQFLVSKILVGDFSYVSL